MQRYNVGFVESDPQIFFSFPLQPEGLSSVKLGKLIECESDEKDEKPKTKKKKSKKEGSASEEEKEEEPIEEVNTDHPHKWKPHHPNLIGFTYYTQNIFIDSDKYFNYICCYFFGLFQGKKVKKSVSFKLEPEIETYDNKPTKKVIRKVKKVVQVRRVRQPITLYIPFTIIYYYRKVMKRNSLN